MHNIDKLSCTSHSRKRHKSSAPHYGWYLQFQFNNYKQRKQRKKGLHTSWKYPHDKPNVYVNLKSFQQNIMDLEDKFKNQKAVFEICCVEGRRKRGNRRPNCQDCGPGTHSCFEWRWFCCKLLFRGWLISLIHFKATKAFASAWTRF